MSAEQLRCRSFQHQAVGSTARRVVPVRYNAGIAFYPADRFCYNVLNGVFVLVDSRKILPVRVPIFQLAYWVLPGGPLFHVEPSRRQARDDHRIETRVFRVPVGKIMYCHEKKARQAGVYRPLPPQVRGPGGGRRGGGGGGGGGGRGGGPGGSADRRRGARRRGGGGGGAAGGGGRGG